jgi:hypothetical protein
MRFLAKYAAPAVALLLLGATVATAQPQPPDIPNIPGAQTERFRMTINGGQHSYFAFSFTLAPNHDCQLHAEGQISEHWEFARGRGVVLQFQKLPGGLVLMHRADRPLGDAAFAAPGTVRREVNGFYDLGSAPGCGGQHNFADEPTCFEDFNVNSDLRLQYAPRRARLSLDRGSTRQVENPAEKCGTAVGGAIDLFTWPYPLLSKQWIGLTKKQIFGRKRAFKLELKDHFIAPLREPIYETVEEKLNGESVVRLRRLP